MAEPTDPNARARNGLRQLAWNEALGNESAEDFHRRTGMQGGDFAFIAEKCAICEEPLDGDLGEMHNPDNPEEHGGIVHAQCGLDAGWVIS